MRINLIQRGADDADDLLLLRLGQRRVDGQREDALVERLRFGAEAALVAELAVERVPVHRDVVDLDADAGFAQRAEDLPAKSGRAAAEAEDVEVPGRVL